MAPFLLLLFLLSEAASDLTVTVRPGDDVILPCKAADSSIRAVKWNRPDLKQDTVLLNIDGRLKTADQNPSFKDRVELVYRELKGRDASLILKNVNIIDTGTYECRVASDDSDPIRLIRTVRLLVADLTVELHPGEDVILPCRAVDPSIRDVEWTRHDLHPEYVLYYRDGHLDAHDQNQYFNGRVDLVETDLKDRDMSLILKNVNRHDNGTYECRVAPAGSRRRKRAIRDSKPIRTIHLQVIEPAGSNSGRSEDGPSSPGGLIGGLAAGVLGLVAAAVVGVLMYKRRKNKRSGQPAADDGEASADKFI